MKALWSIVLIIKLFAFVSCQNRQDKSIEKVEVQDKPWEQTEDISKILSPKVVWKRYFGKGKAQVIGRDKKNTFIYIKNRTFNREHFTILSIDLVNGQTAYIKKDYVYLNSKVLVKNGFLFYTNESGFHTIDIKTGKEIFHLNDSQYEILNTHPENFLFLLKGSKRGEDLFSECLAYSVKKNNIIWGINYTSGILQQSNEFILISNSSGIKIVDKLNGKTISHKLPLNTKKILLIQNEQLIATTSKAIIAYHVREKKLIWKSNVSEPILKCIKSEDQLCVIGQEKVYNLSMKNGSINWTKTIKGSRFKTLINTRNLIFISNTTLKCIDINSGKKYWEVKHSGSKPFLHQGDFYYVNEFNGYYQIKRLCLVNKRVKEQVFNVTLKKQNFFSLSKPNIKRLGSLLLLAGEQVFMPGEEEKGTINLICINLEKEKKIWKKSIEAINSVSRPKLLKSSVLIANDYGKIHAFHPFYGKIQWQLNIKNERTDHNLRIIEEREAILVVYYAGYLVAIDISELKEEAIQGTA